MNVTTSTPPRRRTPWGSLSGTLPLRRPRGLLLRHGGLASGIAILVVLLLASIALPLPHDPLRPDPSALTLAPSWSHPFGTDATGFDVFARTVSSAGRDIPLALLGTLLSIAVGVPLGLAASAGRVGEGMMRVVDAFAALPMIVIAVVAIQLVGGGLFNIVAALAIVNIPRFMRLTRGEALQLRSARYVEAAVAIGCSPVRVALNHVFRNAYGVVLVQASMAAANAVVVIAALSFLGVGVTPPTPTWGSMIQDGTSALVQGKWWVVLFPSLAIFLAVLSFNLIADGIERQFEGRSGS